MSASCFRPRSFTYCMGLNVINRLGNTAARREQSKNRLRYGEFYRLNYYAE